MENLTSLAFNPLQVIIEHGGAAAYMIMIAGAGLVVIGIERIITLYLRLSYDTDGALEHIRALIFDRRYTDAIQVCNGTKTAPTLGVVKAGLLAVENGREAMRSAISNAVLNISHRCEKRLPFISLIANVATLLGLFGTILGLIKTFKSIAMVDPAQKGQMLGVGISEAMYATAAGLCVGIAAMVLHTMCVSKSDEIVGGAQDAGLKLMTWIEQSERSADVQR